MDTFWDVLQEIIHWYFAAKDETRETIENLESASDLIAVLEKANNLLVIQRQSLRHELSLARAENSRLRQEVENLKSTGT